MNYPLQSIQFLIKDEISSSDFPGIAQESVDELEGLMCRILQDNDYNAFQVLFNRMYAPLCQFCLKFVHVKEVAEELVSDVFYNVWKNRRQLTIPSSPKAYLFTAVRNRGVDYLRKVKSAVWCNLENASHVASDITSIQDQLISQELNAQLERCVAGLPMQCRLIFELSRKQNMKYREIALMLSISIKTVETQMGRALKQLRQALTHS
jgi:RNA polymerase sigma-70 factor (family 1)